MLALLRKRSRFAALALGLGAAGISLAIAEGVLHYTGAGAAVSDESRALVATWGRRVRRRGRDGRRSHRRQSSVRCDS